MQSAFTLLYCHVTRLAVPYFCTLSHERHDFFFGWGWGGGGRVVEKTELIVAFRNFANLPRNEQRFIAFTLFAFHHV